MITTLKVDANLMDALMSTAADMGEWPSFLNFDAIYILQNLLPAFLFLCLALMKGFISSTFKGMGTLRRNKERRRSTKHRLENKTKKLSNSGDNGCNSCVLYTLKQ